MLVLQGKKQRPEEGPRTARGLASSALALPVLAELEGPSEEVSGPFLSSLLHLGSVFFGSPDPPFEPETQGQKPTFSWQSRRSPPEFRARVTLLRLGC